MTVAGGHRRKRKGKQEPQSSSLSPRGAARKPEVTAQKIPYRDKSLQGLCNEIQAGCGNGMILMPQKMPCMLIIENRAMIPIIYDLAFFIIRIRSIIGSVGVTGVAETHPKISCAGDHAVGYENWVFLSALCNTMRVLYLLHSNPTVLYKWHSCSWR